MWKRKPSELLFPPKSKLNKTELYKVDLQMMMAMQVLKDETCVSCGLPFWHTHSSDENIVFERDEDTCESCAAKEKIEHEESQIKNKPQEFGITKFMVPKTATENTRLPNRKDYLDRLEAERKAELAAKLARRAHSDGS